MPVLPRSTLETFKRYKEIRTQTGKNRTDDKHLENIINKKLKNLLTMKRKDPQISPRLPSMRLQSCKRIKMQAIFARHREESWADGLTNTGTRNATAQFLVCSIPQSYSTNRPGKHTQEPVCESHHSSLREQNQQPRALRSWMLTSKLYWQINPSWWMIHNRFLLITLHKFIQKAATLPIKI